MNQTESVLYYQSPIGPLQITAQADGVTGIRMAEAMGYAIPGEGASQSVANEAAAQLAEYFAGRRRGFTLPLAPQGTDFQRRVWAALCEIPYGETRSYRAVAEAAGCPKGCRAVGTANHANPILIVIPCHRVINADGSLGGYGGGPKAKRALLALEGLTGF